MKTHLLVALVVITTLGTSWAADEIKDMSTDPKAQAVEKQVRQLIDKNQDYKAAVLAYAKAARANPTEQHYRNQFALARSVAKMEAAMAKEPVAAKWKGYAEAVRTYLYGKGCYQAALAVDQAAWEKFKNAATGVLKIETLLLIGQEAQAKEVAATVTKAEPETVPARWQTLQPVLLAHTNQVDQALAAVADITIDPKQDPTCLFDLARIYKAANKTDEALGTLRLFLEHTIPTEMATSRNMIALCADFQDLKDQDAFKTVLATESKIAQSDCTGGSSCSSCSLRGKCSSSQ